MALLQVSERVIKNTYPSLDDCLDKNIQHEESDLYLANKKVYKIYKNIYRQGKDAYLPILEKNNFDNCINIEDILYQGDKVIGSSSYYIKDFKTFNQIFKEQDLSLYDKKEIVSIFKSVINELLKYNLAYMDSHLSNIGLDKGNLIVSDLDGVWYNPSKSYIEYLKVDICYFYLSLIVKSDIFNNYIPEIFKSVNYYLKCILELDDDVNAAILEKYLDEMTQTKADVIKENYQKILKSDSNLLR